MTNGVPAEQLIRTHTGRQIDKWAHYGRIYDRHLSHLWTSVRRVLEIGVDHGGSLQFWKRYFPTAEIVGLDINPVCKDYGEERISVTIGNQCDIALLESLGEFDIVIDDGSHELQHQSTSFRTLWPKTKIAYLIEDCHKGYPYLEGSPELIYFYPWVLVAEKPQRIIRGEPSHELRPDEQEAREKYGIIK